MLYSEFVFVWNVLVSYHLLILLIRDRRNTIRSFDQIKEGLEGKVLAGKFTKRFQDARNRDIDIQSEIDAQLKDELRNAQEKKLVERELRKKEQRYSTALRKASTRPVNPRGLRKLQTLLGLPCDPSTTGKPRHDEPDMLDAIFVAIDFEYFKSKNGGPRVREVGIATLDTRDVLREYGCTNERSLIYTQHYLTKAPRISFHFGTSMYCSSQDVIDILQCLFYMDEGPHDEIRNIVFVGHHTQTEINILKHLGIDLMRAPSVVEVLDTGLLELEAFRDRIVSGVKLRNVVIKVGIQHQEGFHNAGNDANYTLRAALRLATCPYRPGVLDRNQRLMVEMFQNITA